MRNVMLLWVCCVVVFSGGMMKGEVYEVYKVLPVCESTYELSSPDISGNLVVWKDGGGEGGIYGRYIPDGEIFQISDNASAEDPVVSGDIVVWTDESGDDFNIRGYNLSDACDIIICDASGDQKYPAIEGNIVVWQDERTTEKDIYGYNLETGQIIEACVNDGANQYYPDVGGDYIIWMDNRNGGYDVYGYDLNLQKETEVYTGSANTLFPAVDNSAVVWMSGNNIYGYDLSGAGEFTVCADEDKQDSPAISGGRVVWKDKRSDDGDIYMYNLATGLETVICDDSGGQENPAIDGDIVVWEDDGDIYYAQPVSLQITSPADGEMLLAGSRTELRWESNGPVSDFVKLEYSTDNEDNWQVIDVNASNTGSYVWDTPVADSNQCLLRVSDTDDEEIFAVSGAAFTIFECSQELTADITGDCVVDISDFATLAAQWLICGNPYDPTWCWGD